MELNEKEIVTSYESGESMHSIAKKHGTYTTTIKRILVKAGASLRHDEKTIGQLYVKDGDKLIEWAKKQHRLVTKAELAQVIGRKRLSPSYFLKYPELGQYVDAHEQKDLREYHNVLYNWLKDNNILYKPGDKTVLNAKVDALLLGEYSGIAIHILEKPKGMSKKRHTEQIREKIQKAKKTGIAIKFVDKEQLKDLDSIKPELNALKK